MHLAVLRLGIHFLGSWCKHDVTADLTQEFAVAFESPRVFGKVFVWRKLKLIDEYARNHAVAVLTGDLHERQMSLMQVSHRRDKAHAVGPGYGAAQIRNGLKDFQFS